jgi:hypothetical protein
MMEKEIFDCISKNQIDELKVKLKSFNGDINLLDENGKKILKILNL